MDKRLRYIPRLMYFEAAARLNSYSKAAEELFVSQAAVSQQIRQLEKQLACKLFVRKGREMVLTPEGLMLLKHVSCGFKSILTGLNKLKSEPFEGELLVKSLPSFASRWLLPRLWKFSLKYPDITIKVLTFKGMPISKSSEIDIAIIEGNNLSVENGLLYQALINEPVYPYCSPSLANSINFSKPEDLLKCWLICVENGDFPWESWFKKAGVPIEGKPIQRMSVDTFSTGLDTVLGGHGVCLATDSLAGDLIEGGFLIKPFDIGLTPGVQINLCTDPSSPRKKRIDAFTRWIFEEISKI
ncbi:LysR family transcriptional regulator [Vibrio vulnificus]|uniref:LysR substrate-binding domain-containing protein n=1 Tax=Vibrio vulnificus TaxID=672 RepID=UPI001028CCE4|nr:LysR substrate-binding domain-containing protein [Vibrio vulnificus]EGQ7990769.1 LysR family transcriptional regulator [Vibrio vulnificus]EGR0088760.1 LysR family transcriptional regulator [Vibrio vulnificus]EGR0106910.1 LysR family transcriptional regulator [Vibrio vulnificus]EGR7944009.1 LysR family transcriptional regulator [Vibrio vulnificus]EHU9451628.1 LysR family transcriptional regulator [Vibrio vulnificus]